MKALFDSVSYSCSKLVTNSYSTSFSLASKMLSDSIRQDIYNIYGFVRFADEIVDSFHDYDKETLFNDFETEMYKAIDQKISLNPILNAFQKTVHQYNIEAELYEAFMKSMRLDLHKTNYLTKTEYDEYIYGSADVVGLMCLKVFVKGDNQKYNELKESAMHLGSAFQKVNFLRDLKADFEDLSRTYFPNTDLTKLDESSKLRIIEEIQQDFDKGFEGIMKLPVEAKFGVYTAYIYYKKLLNKLKATPSVEIKNTRIRVPNYQKFGLLAKSYFDYRLHLI
ncbi:phytoene/squalene synthase family protein [Aquimarina sp. SS2-1]|uniref:phytoene/squalene synthase family protein n=1 Tax=Aquimarina besae TaxID=3342247 RepID=UPI00366B14CD